MNKKTFALVSVLLAACNTTADIAAERQALLNRDRAWRAAIAARDAKAIANFWTEDAVLFDAQHPPVAGRAALLQMVQGALQDPKFTINWEDGIVTVAASGDLAYQLTKVRMGMSGSGGAMTQDSDSVAVWRKDADGLWRCAVDISTPSAAKPGK
jgi:uncharacterized protein (TIGR02246 family)